MAYLFIYIDTVVAPTSQMVLVGIAIYGTLQMFVKLVLAIWHHVGWMLCNCCRVSMEPERRVEVENVWRRLKDDYREKVQKSVMDREPRSRIITKNRPQRRN